MGDPTFVLKSIEAVAGDDEEIVRIGYSYDGKYVFETGFVELDVGRNWGIRKVEVACLQKKGGSHYEYKVDVQYKKINGRRFFPLRRESSLLTPKPEVFEHMIVEFDDVWLGPPPDEIFRLTAYGLPDIPLRPQRQASIFTFQNPLLWMTFAASIVSIALLWYLRPRTTSTT